MVLVQTKLYEGKKVSSQRLSPNLKQNLLHSVQKKYFLLCRHCYWMTSTLPYLLENNLINHICSCPVCSKELDKFTIS